MTGSQPPDPMTGLAEAAVQLHELFREYVKAGFSEQQALYLVARILAASVPSGTAARPASVTGTPSSQGPSSRNADPAAQPG